MSITTEPKLIFQDDAQRARLFQGDSLHLLASLEENSIDCIWTDPPYNLSNDGITCIAGKMVKVNKGRELVAMTSRIQ